MSIDEILSKTPNERTPEEIQYLEDHQGELSDEQSSQLDEEKNETSDDSDGTEDSAEGTQEDNKDENTDSEDEAGDTTILNDVGSIVRKEFSVEVKDLGEGMLEAVVASEAIDRHGERIDMKGLDIKKYMQNPVIAWGHRYDEPSIGKTTKLTKTSDGKLVAKMEFAVGIYEKARTIYNLYKGGFMKAFSIGFIPYEVEGNRYTKSEMIEFSAVLVPANPEALLLARSKGIDTNTLITYHDNMSTYELATTLEKSLEDLTLGEVKFLQENSSKLSEEQKAKFASVLEVKDTGADMLKAMDEKLAAFKKEMDPVVVKDINTNKGSEGDKMTKEIKFLYYVRGLKNGNFNEYESIVGKDAMNTTDTGDVLPPTEFVAEVERLEEEVGVGRQYARVRRSSAPSITIILGDDDLEIYDTAESGVKKSTKLGYAQQVMTWRKFAGILPITDELTQDSAVDLWTDASRRFARAFTRQEDVMIFTRADGGTNLYPGVLKVTGTNEVTIDGDSIADVSFDDLNEMIYGVPTPSADRGRFYLHRTVLGVIQTVKNPTTGEYVWKNAPAEGQEATIWGKPYTLVDVMPSVSDDNEDTAFMAFGDLDYVTLAERTGLEFKIGSEGIVGDPDEEDQDTNTLNLFTQDMQAMRAVKRMNARVRFPAAFSVLKTGPAAS